MPGDLAGRGEQRIVIHRKGGNPPWIYGERIRIEGGDEGIIHASPDDFVRITVAEDARHEGRAGTGACIYYPSGEIVHSSLPYTCFEWLEIKGGDGDAMVECKAGGIAVENCIIHDNEFIEDGGAGIEITAADIVVRNSIIYNTQSHGVIAVGPNTSASIRNVTVFNAGDCGIDVRDGASLCIQNCISMASQVNDFRKWFAEWVNCSNNMSSDGSAPGINYLRNKSSSNQFFSIAPGNENFHLKSGSDAIDKGTAIQEQDDVDIDGFSRQDLWSGTNSWDIGADEAIYLTDIVFSEGAYAHYNESGTLAFKAVIPDYVSSVKLTPSGPEGVTFKVNGRDPLEPVSISSSPMQITVEALCGGISFPFIFTVTQNEDYAICVNPDAQGLNNGTSWPDAYTDLQSALNDAAQNGKEIWIAEGNYTPSMLADPSDPRSATFMLRQGMEIVGSFAGIAGETRQSRMGSLYYSYLSGDINGDDHTGSSWPLPAEFIDDNAYHVLTITGNNGAASIYIEGVSIVLGNADGSGKNAIGAGVFNTQCAPQFVLCLFWKNFAKSNGGGMFNGGNAYFEKCGFSKNLCQSGNGMGIYNEKCIPVFEGCIFDQNGDNGSSVIETSTRGAAMYNNGSKPKISNSIFYRNEAKSNGGAICNETSNVSIINCTFTDNESAKRGGAIASDQNSRAIIKNSILWRDAAGASFEIDGPATVSFSCIWGGYEGEGNIAEDPHFRDINSAVGFNRKYGDDDDGLILSPESPCIDAGTSSGAPHKDIVKIERPYGSTVDMGAYEYIAIASGDIQFGMVRKDGSFEVLPTTPIINYVLHGEYIRIYSFSKLARVVKALVEKSDYTKNKSYIYTDVIATDANNNPLPGAKWVRIGLYKVGEEGGKLVFQSMTASEGKPVLFVANTRFQNWNNPYAHVIYMLEGSKILSRTPYSQF
ncbi:MAG: hypothetical protein GF350_08740 [Chitinivibrionales bacterium]|nr:hypothetical protein [Chitinivibrionales bacterium]